MLCVTFFFFFFGGGRFIMTYDHIRLEVQNLLENKNCYTYDNELHTATNGVSKIYIKPKMKWFAQSMSILETQKKSEKVLWYDDKKCPVNTLWDNFYPKLFANKSLSTIAHFIWICQYVLLLEMCVLTFSKCSITMWMQSHCMSLWHMTFWWLLVSFSQEDVTVLPSDVPQGSVPPLCLLGHRQRAQSLTALGPSHQSSCSATGWIPSPWSTRQNSPPVEKHSQSLSCVSCKWQLCAKSSLEDRQTQFLFFPNLFNNETVACQTEPPPPPQQKQAT